MRWRFPERSSCLLSRFCLTDDLLDLVLLSLCPTTSWGQSTHANFFLQARLLNIGASVAKCTTSRRFAAVQHKIRARESPGTLVIGGQARRESARRQAKPGPGSVLRPGETSLCAARSRSGNAVRRRAIRSSSAWYCASSNGPSSVPSSSTPTEKSLQVVRPRQDEAPACQARRWIGTNCTTLPSRRTRK